MKTIRLTQGFETIIDDADFDKVNQYKWMILRAPSGKIYATHGGGKTRILLHRFLMNPLNNLEIDHVNGNALDNRKSNLRVCTHAENMRNKRIYKNNTTGYKGVYFRKDSKKYASCIKINGKNISLGSYTNKTDASNAYNKAAETYFGEFASFNI